MALQRPRVKRTRLALPPPVDRFGAPLAAAALLPGFSAPSDGGAGFNALAAYLFGANDRGEAMAMTMPVEIARGAEGESRSVQAAARRRRGLPRGESSWPRGASGRRRRCILVRAGWGCGGVGVVCVCVEGLGLAAPGPAQASVAEGLLHSTLGQTWQAMRPP